MVTNRINRLGLGLVIVCIILVCHHYQRWSSGQSSRSSDATKPPNKEFDDLMKLYKVTAAQRNELSASQNILQEKHQQLVCQTRKATDTSESGGWCNSEFHTGHMTDDQMAKGLEELLFNKTVVGLGDGPGKYRRMLLDSGAVKKYDSYDGAPNIKNLTNGQVTFLDLTLPQYWLPVYDWVIILEVMEHIPPKYENVVLDNVARVAGMGVILSWAVPGQVGHHHINCQSFAYVQSVMELRNFKHDSALSIQLQQKASFKWFKTNIQVFTRV